MNVTEFANRYGLQTTVQERHPHYKEFSLDDMPTIAVLQARETQKELDNELNTFAAVNGPVPTRFLSINVISKSWVDDAIKEILDEADATHWSGSDIVNVTSNSTVSKLYKSRAFPVMEEIVDRDMLSFGTCLGHQAFHKATRGEVEALPDMAQIGTPIVVLNEEGAMDPYALGIPKFQESLGVQGAASPSRFAMNHGHNESVTEMGEGFVLLGSTLEKEGNSIRNKFALTRRGSIFTVQGHAELEDKNTMLARVNSARAHGYEPNFPIRNTPGSTILIAEFHGAAAKRAQRRRSR